MKLGYLQSTRAAGFTLIEVLIALLVLAVGLLGFAALQISSVNNNQEAAFQSQAQAIADDLSSRMRINRDYIRWDVRAPLQNGGNPDPAVDDNIYSASPYHGTADANAGVENIGNICGAAPQAFTGVAGFPETATTGQECDTAGTTCTEKQMAAFDRWEICRSAVNALPDGEVHVTCQARAIEADEIKINPYINPPHPVFTRGTDGYLRGNAPQEACPPDSLYSIAVYWSPSAAARGVGERSTGNNALGAAVNPRCDTTVTAGSGIPKACVIVDIQP